MLSRARWWQRIYSWRNRNHHDEGAHLLLSSFLAAAAHFGSLRVRSILLSVFLAIFFRRIVGMD
jgi:hypothetical protein